MIKFTKLLRIGLPVATLTAATIITATLLFSNREDNKDNDENKDKVLDDFEKPLELYQEEIINKPDNQEEDTKQEEKEGDNKEELDENEQKAKSQIEEQLKKEPNKKKLIDDLLNRTEELAKRLSLENKLTKEQFKEVVSKIPELAEELFKAEQKASELEGAPDAPLESNPQGSSVEEPQISSEEPKSVEPDDTLIEEEPGGEDHTSKSEEALQRKVQNDVPDEKPKGKENELQDADSIVQEEEVDVTLDSEGEDVEEMPRETIENDNENAPPEKELADNFDSSSSDVEEKEKLEASGQPSAGQESDALDSSFGVVKGGVEDETNEGEGSANSITEELLKEMEEITGRAATAISYLQKLINKQ